MADGKARNRLCGFILQAVGAVCVLAALVFRVSRNFCQPDYKDRYQWAKCLTEGLLPYRDFNMLQTPLSLYYYSVFFRFSRSVHTGLLAASLLILLTALFCFLIAGKLKPGAGFFPVALWTAAMLLGQGSIYTSMSVLLWVAALYCYYRYREKPRIGWLIPAAVLCNLCFFSKQNAGALCLLSLGLCFLLHWFRSKTPLKTAFAHAAVLVSCYAVCWGLWLGFFAAQGILSDFAEHCLFSAGSFVSSQAYWQEALKTALLDSALLLAVCILLRVPELGITGACMLWLAFPICNAPMQLPALSMLAVAVAAGRLPESGRLKQYGTAALLAGGGLMLGYQAMMQAYFQLTVNGMLGYNPYEAMRTVQYPAHGDFNAVAADLEDRFHDGLLPYLEAHRDTISDYHIADTLGAFYNIPFDRYDRYYDLFLAGNLGAKTPLAVVDGTIAAESGHYFIVWADAESQSVPGFADAAVLDAVDSIRQRCILTETLHCPDGTASYSIYQIP